MYCQNCGCENQQEAAFCHQCGVKLVKVTPSVSKRSEEEGAISSVSDVRINNEDIKSFSSTTKLIKTKAKKIMVVFVSLFLVVICVTSLFRISDKKCDWCNDSPSIRFTTNDGGNAYVCFDCCKECAWCGERATRHYENLMEMIVFVCKDCYDEIKD